MRKTKQLTKINSSNIHSFIGKKIKLLNAALYGQQYGDGHTYTHLETFVLGSVASVNGTTVYISKGPAANYGLAVNYNMLEALTPISKEEIQKELDELTKEYNKNKKELTVKLEFLNEVGSNEFDENQFKVFKTLQILAGEKSDFEKSKIIAELING